MRCLAFAVVALLTYQFITFSDANFHQMVVVSLMAASAWFATDLFKD